MPDTGAADVGTSGGAPPAGPRDGGKNVLFSFVKWAIPALLVVPFFTVKEYQAAVCQIGPLVAAQADGGWRKATVRKICFQNSSWSPTSGEVTELADAFLAKASGAEPTSALQLYADDLAGDLRTQFRASWAPVMWAERSGSVRRRNSDTFRVIYKMYFGNTPNVPAEGSVRWQQVDVVVAFTGNGEARIKRWGGATYPKDLPTIEDRAYPAAYTSRELYTTNLPDEGSSRAVLLRRKDTVRLICRLLVGEREWMRSTDGWLPVDALAGSVPQVAACEPQHAMRAQAEAAQ